MEPWAVSFNNTLLLYCKQIPLLWLLLLTLRNCWCDNGFAGTLYMNVSWKVFHWTKLSVEEQPITSTFRDFTHINKSFNVQVLLHHFWRVCPKRTRQKQNYNHKIITYLIFLRFRIPIFIYFFILFSQQSVWIENFIKISLWEKDFYWKITW